MWRFCLILFISACIKPHITSRKVADFILVDTSSPATEYLEMQRSTGYPIYYIGPVKDTINIGQRYDRKRTPIPRWPEIFPVSFTYSDRNLHIEVDTLVDTNCPDEYYSKDLKIDPDLTRNYHASVFTIKNVSDSIVCMGRTFFVYYMHRELKNRQGQWIQMDKSLSQELFCGTGQPTINLRPGEMILSKVKHYKGNFKTDCRLVFGYSNRVVYSNVFSEFVDEKIFSFSDIED